MLRVGPGEALKAPSDAARVARDGDTVEVVAGIWDGDVATWLQDRLTLRAVGGVVRLRAAGRSAGGKGIWVVRGGRVAVEGFEFSGARVADRNGCGIRFETGRLHVAGCRFVDNEMGLLTNHDADAELVVERCEFAHNRRPDGHNHNLYVGRIAQLDVRHSHFHDAETGHLLKSRARRSVVVANRLVDGGGRASYELEFPNGGHAIVVGNVVAQSAATRNPTIVAWGAEGLVWPDNALVMAHNTVVNFAPRPARFVRLFRTPDEARLGNNLWVGAGGLQVPPSAERVGNRHLRLDELVDAAGGDFRPRDVAAVTAAALPFALGIDDRAFAVPRHGAGGGKPVCGALPGVG